MLHPTQRDRDTFSESELFLSTRWHELFDKNTPDSFHPKLFGVGHLVKELIDVAKLAQKQDPWKKHVELICEEIKERINSDFFRKCVSSRHFYLLNEICNSKIPLKNIIDYSRILLLEDLDYKIEVSLMDLWNNIDFSSELKRKEDANTVITQLATYVFRKGNYISKEDHENTFDGNIKNKVVDVINNKNDKYTIIVCVEISEYYKEHAIRNVCSPVGILSCSPKIKGLSGKNNVVFLKHEIEEQNKFLAANIVKKKVKSQLNILSLYKQLPAPKIADETWVLLGDRAEIIGEYQEFFRNIHPRKNANALSIALAKSITNKNSLEDYSIRSALELHNVALSLSDDRLRLVHLWSALECLSSLEDCESIFRRVESIVVPLLAWQKIDKNMTYLSICLHEWMKENPSIKTNLHNVFLKNNVNPGYLLTCLTDVNECYTKELLDITNGHPLLKNRIFISWKLLQDHSKLFHDLEQSKKHLIWHLMRIYRARNLLIHQGIEYDCLPQLANHLQQYFSWVLTRIVHGYTLGPKWTARDSLRYWQHKASYLFLCLKGNNQNELKVCDLFPKELEGGERIVWNKNIVAN